MKNIKYQVAIKVNHGTEEEPNIVETILPREIERCPDASFEANYATAKAEAYNGEITVEEVADPEPPAPSGDPSIWDEMDAAYQEGVDSV